MQKYRALPVGTSEGICFVAGAVDWLTHKYKNCSVSSNIFVMGCTLRILRLLQLSKGWGRLRCN